MPKLLRLNDDANGTGNGAAAGAAAQLEPAGQWTPESGKGLKLSVDQEIEERFLAAPLIGIEFPTFSDGRGLSLAFLLRSRHGYQGDLVATGAVQADILHYMRRCGFTAALLPGGEAPDAQTLAPHSDYYQACATEPEPGRFRIGGGPSNIPT
ncbi:MAG: DUF934 domain-containing protein [Gammaproteobacteria bacterium]|nr:DUF934 domain-containing protein [Gammaproteobacteria bacterium]MCY4344643.1 DUF934 domain-containing protein [Gammaproteobacteria bacterium]